MCENALTVVQDAKHTPTETEQLQKVMEYLIDRFTALGVIVALGEACQSKSDKLAAGWQDVPVSEAWQQLSEQIFCLECDGL